MGISTKTTSRPAVFFFLSFLTAALILAGCQGKGERKGEVISKTDVAPIELPREHQAIITFLSGEVFLFQEGGWKETEIGASVSVDDRLKVGEESYCEIQFGNTGMARIQENTEILMESLYLKTSEVKIGLKMNVGAIIARINKLSSGEEFRLSTRSVAVGVRGTIFLLREEEGENPVLAVKEGKVSIVSAAIDIPGLKEKVADKDAGLLERIDKLEEAFILVEEDQEITVDKTTLEETKLQFEEVVAIIDRFLEQLEKEEIEEISAESLQLLEEKIDAVVESVEQEYPPIIKLSEENAREMEKAGQAEMIRIPEVEEKEDVRTSSEELIRIAVHVEPEDAEIFLNRRSMGYGSVAGVFRPGDKLVFIIRKEGYLEQKLELSVEEGGNAEYSILLEREKTAEKTAEKPTETIRVVVEPGDAEIFINGAFAAEGSCERRFSIGETVVLDVRKMGYKDKHLELEIAKGAGGTYELCLEPDPIVLKYPVSKAAIVGAISADERWIVGANRISQIFIYDRVENIIKPVRTKKEPQMKPEPNVNSSPVMHGNRIFFIGIDLFLTADLSSSRIVNTVQLYQPGLYPAGRGVMPFHDRGLYTDGGRLLIFDLISGRIIRKIPLPLDLPVTPVPYQDVALIISEKGRLLIYDREGNLSPAFPEPILPSGALLIKVKENRFLAMGHAGREGIFVCVDLESREILWEKFFPTDKDPDIPLALECGTESVYLFNGDRLFGWSGFEGRELFPVMNGVSSPPLYHDGFLCFGTNEGGFRIVDAFNGDLIKYLQLGERITARPWFEEGHILVGTEMGNIFVINPEAIP